MDDEFKDKDEELNEDEDSVDDDIILGSKGKKSKGLSEDSLLGDEPESLDELAELEDEEDEPYDDVDKW